MTAHSRSQARGLITGGFSRRRFLTGSVVGLTSLAAARWVRPVSAQSPPGQIQPWGTTYVGQTDEDPNTLVGMVSDGLRLFCYVCADPVVAGAARYNQVVGVGGGDWFHGISTDGATVQLTSPAGAVLQLDLTGVAPVGTIQTVDGNVLNIGSDVATGIAGIYRDQKKDRQGNTYTAGWIIAPTPDLSQVITVGAIQGVDLSGAILQPLPAPAPNPTNPTLAVTAASINLMFTPTPLANIQNLQF